MAKLKKTFDRESMYKKIMPTNLKKEEQVSEEVLNHPEKEIDSKETIFQNKEFSLIKDEKKEVILYNITEKLVLNKLDATLKKMNCCRCDRCKEDIIAVTLNNLKPMYVVGTRDIIKEKVQEMQDKSGEVTTEVLKAVLTVRKNPRH